MILAESQRDGGRQGTRLPTERRLALDLGVSRSAIRHAMTLLQAEGHVSREVGRGTFLRGVPDAGAAGPVDAPAAPGARMRRYRKLRRRPRGRTTKPRPT
jgi:DNA-binding FadR family transcriptional regulator